MGNRRGNSGNSVRLYFWGAPESLQMVTVQTLLGRKVMTNLESIFKRRHYFVNKCPSSQGYCFSNSRVWMWELDCEESWALKNWCFWTVVLENTLESPLGCKGIQLVHPKGDQSWVFFRRNDVKLKLQYFGHIMRRADSLEKTLMLGGIGGRRWRGRQRMRWLDSITDSMDVSTGRPGVLRFVGSQRVGHDWATELNWMTAVLSHSGSPLEL